MTPGLPDRLRCKEIGWLAQVTEHTGCDVERSEGFATGDVVVAKIQ